MLKRLVGKNGRTYSDLTQDYDSETNIAFHLKQLLNENLVEKRTDGYFLTAKGVSVAQSEDFKVFFVGFVCNCGDEYLVKPHENAKTNFYNLPSGAPLFGEDLKDALPRLFYQQFGLTLPYNAFLFDSLHLKTVITSEKDVLFDEAFTVYRIDITINQRNLLTFPTSYTWMTVSEILKLPNKWPEIDLCILKKDWKIYNVYNITSDYILR